MENNFFSILSTRPLDARSLTAVPDNFQIDIASFIETKNIVDDIIEQKIISLAKQNAIVVFTSMNAAEAVLKVLEKNHLQAAWTIFCLGNTTKKILQSFFAEDKIYAAANSALSLAEKIIEQKISAVVFFCGNIRRDELPTTLQQHQIKVDEVVVYETIQSSKNIDKNYNGILFFSPSAVNSFFSENQINNHTIVFAIGETTANTLKHFCSNTIVVSDFPDKEMLLQQAISYFKHTKTQA
jgi:uroporphyrinogen-III synthase